MRHNDYPTTLLMEPAANDEPARYRMTPAASTERAKREEPTSAELTAAEDYWHACHMFEAMAHDMPEAVVSFHPGAPPMGTLADMVADCTPVSGAALIGFKREPEADSRIGRRVVAIEGDGCYFAAGDAGVVTDIDGDGDLMVRFDPSPTSEPGPFWYVSPKNVRFIDTPAPAAQESAKRVIRMGPRCWRIASLEGPYGCVHDYTCDADGWISHTPTADAVCPVPDGVEFETRRRDGEIIDRNRTPPGAWELGFRHSRTFSPGDVVAWRPIQA